MKFIVLGLILFTLVTYWIRKRGDPKPPKSARKSAMFDADTVDLRSAENVRLISDDQLEKIESPKTV